ncbi:hypothetical protein CRD60_07305 [Bifidobacterium aemilianum]|uniref:Tyrosine specific protein phosphatases domain-containing protein n=1 Tax=Bifidobacterium aemilianum TaxID=2493120 RepID=A0A366K7Q2_9BIFI|nr:tyrosine-protein phosphatase [Bifidobacterium aemilianum]RBP97337.1 hypothetical protein CRD60_07305 [Bifidobacterium aemilianum]
MAEHQTQSGPVQGKNKEDFVPEGDGRGITISGVPNARGIGGFPTLDGRRTKSGLFFRSAGLNFMDEGGVDDLHRLGVKLVVDLRAPWEVSQWPYQLPDDIKVERVSLLSEDSQPGDGSDGTLGEQAQGEELGMQMAPMYRDIAFGSAGKIMGILKELATGDGHPMLIHCTAGKDRTGITAGILMSLLGVQEDMVVSSYAQSAGNLGQAFKEAVLKGLPADAQGADDLEGAQSALLASPPALLQGLLQEIRQRFGSVEGYCLRNGMEPAEVQTLRDLFLE